MHDRLISIYGITIMGYLLIELKCFVEEKAVNNNLT